MYVKKVAQSGFNINSRDALIPFFVFADNDTNLELSFVVTIKLHTIYIFLTFPDKHILKKLLNYAQIKK